MNTMRGSASRNLWQVFPTISAPMSFQLALDEILLTHAIRHSSSLSQPMVRFYYSSEPWVSIGYSRRGFRRSYALSTGKPMDIAGRGLLDRHKHLLRIKDLPVSRRITGGGKVVHGRDLIFSLIARREDDVSFESVRMSYLKIHEAVKNAFERLGFAPRFYRCDEFLPKGEDCFIFPIATDLAIGKKKIAGGAQKRTQGFLLHQESLSIPQGIQGEDMIKACKSGFEHVYSAALEPARWEPAWLKQAKALGRIKYESDYLNGPNTDDQMDEALTYERT